MGGGQEGKTHRAALDPALVDALDVQLGTELRGGAVPDPLIALPLMPLLVAEEVAVDVLQLVAVPVREPLEGVHRLGPRHADVEGEVDPAPSAAAAAVPEPRD